MSNRLIAIVAVVVLAAGAAFVLVLRDGLSADRPPGRLETIAARQLVRLSIPLAQREVRNPYSDQPDSWRAGAARFTTACSSCHGSDGRGHTTAGAAMYPPVPDLGDDAVQDLSDGALFAIIQHGIRWTGMPAFGRVQPAETTWQLVSYIRHVGVRDVARSHP
jgi:mono/diheme cytochrome c family protein